MILFSLSTFSGFSVKGGVGGGVRGVNLPSPLAKKSEKFIVLSLGSLVMARSFRFLERGSSLFDLLWDESFKDDCFSFVLSRAAVSRNRLHLRISPRLLC